MDSFTFIFLYMYTLRKINSFEIISHPQFIKRLGILKHDLNVLNVLLHDLQC